MTQVKTLLGLNRHARVAVIGVRSWFIGICWQPWPSVTEWAIWQAFDDQAPVYQFRLYGPIILLRPRPLERFFGGEE